MLLSLLLLNSIELSRVPELLDLTVTIVPFVALAVVLLSPVLLVAPIT
jgi:hypothetical protein